MDPSTELASNFTIARYRELRPALTSGSPGEEAWLEVVGAVQRRIQERFLTPVNELARFDENEELPYRPGFAILAIDCLLIDTIQSFREGRVTTGEISPAHSFKSFLSSKRFADFKAKDRDDFFGYVRNAILHNGETRKNWKVRIDTKRMVDRDSTTGTRTINRQLFHAAIELEFTDLMTSLRTGDSAAREHFLRRLDAMAGLPISARRNFYFAYGSNLNGEECCRTAPHAEGYAVAFLPGFRLTFAKHSVTRQGDAATIAPDPASMVWGYVYRLDDDDRKALQKREGGYQECEITVYATGPTALDEPTPLSAFTFAAMKECPLGCGPPPAYLELVIEGAKDRHLPEAYCQALLALRVKHA